MVRFCARSRSIFRDLKSLSTTWYQVFRVSPFLCYPTTLSQYFFTKLYSLDLSTRKTHLNLPLLMWFLMLLRPKRFLSFEEGFLSFKVTYTSILTFSYCCPPTFLIYKIYKMTASTIFTNWLYLLKKAEYSNSSQNTVSQSLLFRSDSCKFISPVFRRPTSSHHTNHQLVISIQYCTDFLETSCVISFTKETLFGSRTIS